MHPLQAADIANDIEKIAGFAGKFVRGEYSCSIGLSFSGMPCKGYAIIGASDSTTTVGIQIRLETGGGGNYVNIISSFLTPNVPTLLNLGYLNFFRYAAEIYLYVGVGSTGSAYLYGFSFVGS